MSRAPHAGHSCDEVRLVGSNELHITTYLTVIGKGSCAYRVVYWRAGTTGSGKVLPPPPSPLMNMIKSASQKAFEAMGIESARSVLPPLPPFPKHSRKHHQHIQSHARTSTADVSGAESGAESVAETNGARHSYDSSDGSTDGNLIKARRQRRLSGQRPFSKVLDL